MDNVTHALAGCLLAEATVVILEKRGNDHTLPASVTKANFNLFKKSMAVTEFREYPDRTH